MKVKAICVLRSGGDYSVEDVYSLKAQVDRHSNDNIDFVCLSDTELNLDYTPLLHDWKGWWSVQEMFRIEGPAFAVGLDTVVVNDLQPIIDFTLCLDSNEFGLLRPFGNIEKWSNGVMCWNGNFNFIYEKFLSNPRTYINRFRMEHRFTWNTLVDSNIKIVPIQDNISGKIVSYKWGCVRNGINGSLRESTYPPDGTIVVCFHGKPRPKDVTDNWVVEARKIMEVE